MAGPGKSFGDDLKRFRFKSMDRADKLIRQSSLALFGSVIKDSPVGDPDNWNANSLPPPPGYVGGRFRANWNCSLGRPDTTAIQAPSPGDGEYKNFPDVAAKESKMKGTIQTGDRKSVFFLSNSLPYAQRLEDGYSGQAPQGMVKRNVVRMRGIIARQLAILKGKAF